MTADPKCSRRRSVWIFAAILVLFVAMREVGVFTVEYATMSSTVSRRTSVERTGESDTDLSSWSWGVTGGTRSAEDVFDEVSDSIASYAVDPPTIEWSGNGWMPFAKHAKGTFATRVVGRDGYRATIDGEFELECSGPRTARSFRRAIRDLVDEQVREGVDALHESRRESADGGGNWRRIACVGVASTRLRLVVGAAGTARGSATARRAKGITS
ncbi:MAG: hypothetical protein R3F34_11075 [Planctomycetota bacterium]